MQNSQAPKRVNRRLYEKALATEGFFSVEEADLLIRSINNIPSAGLVLEVGSYRGRSALFALAALHGRQRLVVVDSFRTAGSYAGHSYWELLGHLDDARACVLPMTLPEAYVHLRSRQFDLVFIDGDHSFSGVAQDLAYGIALTAPQGVVLCHDVCELFPGVLTAVDALIRAGVLARQNQIGKLVVFQLCRRPSWLLDPSVFRGEQIPGPPTVTS